MRKILSVPFPALLALALSTTASPAPPEDPSATGQCVQQTASAERGTPPGIAHGEPNPDSNFPFTCDEPPGARP